MTHGDISVGDVVYDIGKGGGKMVVVDRVADSIVEHREGEDYDIASYKHHPNLPVREDDAVFTCVYIPDTPGSHPASGTYDFPAGRLARAPIEEANKALDPIQDVIVRDVLEDLLVMASAIDSTGTVDESRATVLLDVAGDVLDESIVRDAEELARSNPDWQGNGSTEPASDGDDAVDEDDEEDSEEADPDAEDGDEVGQLGDFEPTAES
ncbi:hypothetical protein PhiCh1p59 [Natrialba phage PhiCh1]|uniref:Virus protein phiCh1-VP58 n=2 Tax=root TaxID=1 RepID=D3T2K2_NATMM|nr:hypothetical protein [Natrialba magadii]NP_665976.1 hypothetical protein PhiCh1p59 [Natrialba phage PhiCh1]YP_010078084.1 uncharacterized protein KMC42_gp54 [Natrialba phage PhiCh1]AAM88732.1 unknown [Natrialba phage PhiCh1]ADD07811.1 virus protein phiCh1-VP58 [Natrialba magadii ATCC 43099]ELY22964.1 hypothetical protein C500_20910 [Natrialba magadii ATCC 43099]QBJ01235.1 uncharacterized protein PhiCh1_265 [Natrialba phage PhiCh1]